MKFVHAGGYRAWFGRTCIIWSSFFFVSVVGPTTTKLSPPLSELSSVSLYDGTSDPNREWRPSLPLFVRDGFDGGEDGEDDRGAGLGR